SRGRSVGLFISTPSNPQSLRMRNLSRTVLPSLIMPYMTAFLNGRRAPGDGVAAADSTAPDLAVLLSPTSAALSAAGPSADQAIAAAPPAFSTFLRLGVRFIESPPKWGVCCPRTSGREQC